MKKHSKISFISIIRLSKAPLHLYLILLLCITYLAAFNALFSFTIQSGIALVTQGLFFQKFLLYLSFFILICAIFSLAIYNKDIVEEKIIQHIARHLKYSVIESFITMELKESQSYTSGDFVTHLFDDCDNLAQYACRSLIPLLQLILTIIIGIIYVFTFSMNLLSIALFFAPFLYFLNLHFSKKMKQLSLETQQNEGKLRSYFHEYHKNNKIITIFQLHKQMFDKFNNLAENKINLSDTAAKNLGWMVVGTEIIIMTVEVTTLILGVYFVSMNALSIPVLFGAWNVIIGSILYPLSEFPSLLEQASIQNASLERISLVFNLKSKHSEKNHYIVHQDKTLPQSEILLKVNNLEFSYNDKNTIIQSLSFSCQTGDIVYITGESGCGKSTFGKIIGGLIKANSGEITVSLNAKDVPSKLFQYTAQENKQFLMNLNDNLKLGQDISTDEIHQILESLNLSEQTLSLLKNDSLIIGQNFKLSEGESQRISIARALVQHAAFTILDEPFSSLDPESIQVAKNLIAHYREKYSMGFIIISHIEDSSHFSNKTYILNGGTLYE